MDGSLLEDDVAVVFPATNLESILTDATSLMTTAIRNPCLFSNISCNNVVLPLPKNPLSIVMGITSGVGDGGVDSKDVSALAALAAESAAESAAAKQVVVLVRVQTFDEVMGLMERA